MAHPCHSCGACCAYFRVAFYWREAESFPDQDSFEDFDSLKRQMRGTNQKHGLRCCKLEGKVGEQVSCSMYKDRPTPCREFRASYENGEQNQRCDEARAHYGLPPLRPRDWPLQEGAIL
jgi:Fe-S-cluster containining protein